MGWRRRTGAGGEASGTRSASWTWKAPIAAKFLRDLLPLVDQLGEADPIVLGEHSVQPVPDIAAQHERIRCRLAVARVIGGKGMERHRRHLDLLAGKLVQARDRDLLRSFDALEIRIVGGRLPV